MSQANNTNTGTAKNTFSLSVVVPIYNESQGINSFFTTIIPILKTITPNWQIICVDDGSTDDSFEQLTTYHKQHPTIEIIKLSRNFGKEIALSAGLDHAAGDAVIPIDANL